MPEVGRNAFATCAAHDLVDEIVTVDEHAIALSILRLVEIEQVRVTQFFLVVVFLLLCVVLLVCGLFFFSRRSRLTSGSGVSGARRFV